MTKRHSHFGQEVKPLLESSGTSQVSLGVSISVARGEPVSTAYVNHTLSGAKKPNAEWVELVANALNVTPEQRARLHRAAAMDNGFKLDLTTKE